ncbi:MAG: MATE family efflux transporter [Chromatiales bacterium]|jgi:putative MATE family efflux protein
MPNSARSTLFEPGYRNIWRISYPLMLAGISETVIDITDTIFLARYGITELAAIGLADAWYMLFLFLSFGLVDGIQVIIGRRAGQDRAQEIGRVFTQGLYLLVMVSFLMIALMHLVMHLGLGELLASRDIMEATESYLRIAIYSLLFQSISLAFSAFYVSIAQTRILIGAALVLAISNIALDYALIFGNFGLPEMGIEGAALASLSAEILACLFLVASVFYKRYDRQYGLLRLTRWDNSIVSRLASISWPVALDTLVELIRWFLLFVIIEQMGEAELASANIIYSCFAVMMISIDSFSEAVCSMVSNLLGQNRREAIGELISKTTQLSYLVVIPLLAMALLFPDIVLAIFTEDELLIELSRGALPVVLLALLPAVPGSLFYAAVVGTGDTIASLMIQLITTLCALAFTAWTALVLSLPLEQVLFVELIVWILYLLFSWLWLRGGSWRRLSV